jgi:hypothetical protein
VEETGARGVVMRVGVVAEVDVFEGELDGIELCCSSEEADEVWDADEVAEGDEHLPGKK